MRLKFHHYSKSIAYWHVEWARHEWTERGWSFTPYDDPDWHTWTETRRQWIREKLNEA